MSKRPYNRVKDGKKICPTCEKDLPVSCFYLAKGKPFGSCIECKKIYTANVDKAKKSETARKHHLKKNYGISIEQYNELLTKQEHCCAICDKHEDDEKNRRLAVDHNHETGEIRGLLCAFCNHRVVGRHKDGDLLRKVADYIEQGTGWFAPKKKRPVKRKPKRN